MSIALQGILTVGLAKKLHKAALAVKTRGREEMRVVQDCVNILIHCACEQFGI
jgi:hypothetical protein